MRAYKLDWTQQELPWGKFLALSKIPAWSQILNCEGSVNRLMGSSHSITSLLQSTAWGCLDHPKNEPLNALGVHTSTALTPNLVVMLVL